MGQHSRLSILGPWLSLSKFFRFGFPSCALRFRYLLSVASSPSSVRWCSTLELMVGMIHGEAVILWCHVVPWFKSTGFSGFFGKGLWSFGSIAFGLSSLIVNRLPNQLLGWRSVFS
ncbi:unnamed protein product [Brassica oleracea]